MYMKLYKTLILLLFISFSFVSVAQEEINYPNIDKKTYEQYQNKDWKELIKTGKQSLKNNIDFYYLHVRMGIAFYELKKYAKAVKHFENSYSTNKNDELIQEYLYYSYLFTGQENEARTFSANFSSELKEKLRIKKSSFINSLYSETMFNFTEDYFVKRKFGDLIKQKSILEKSYYNLSFEHLIGKRFTILHGYSNIKLKNTVLEALQKNALPFLFEEDIKQHEYYFSVNCHILKKTDLLFAFHYLNTNILATGTEEENLYKYNANSYVGAVYLTNNFSIFKTKIGTSVSNLNKKLQIQPELNIRIYPFGNANLFTETSAIFMMQNSKQSGKKIKDGLKSLPVFKQSIGINIFNYAWFQSSFSYGNMLNYTEHSAFVANNDIDKNKMRIGGLLNIPLKKLKIDLFLKYQYNLKENEYLFNGTQKMQEYINQSIIGGIKYSF